MFAPEEVGGDRKIGKGHNSILSTDIVSMNNSMFHNPKIVFREDTSNIKSAKDIIQKETPIISGAQQMTKNNHLN